MVAAFGYAVVGLVLSGGLSVALIELFSPSHLDGALLLVPCDMTTSFCRPSAQSPLPSQPLTWLPLGSLLSSLEEENDDSELDSE